MIILEGLSMKIFVVDQGLFNGKKNAKRVNKKIESKRTNQHVSDLNVSMNGNYGKCKWKSCDTFQGKW